jgi:hypothetical protein
MHLRKAVGRKLIVMHETDPYTYSTARGAAGKSGVVKSKRGNAKNGELILRALDAAGRPLNREGFAAALPELGAMQPTAIHMALSKAAREGVIKRVAPGLYDRGEAGERAGPKGKKPERPADGRKAASVPPVSVPESASASVQLAMVN